MDARKRKQFRGDLEMLRRAAWPHGNKGLKAVQNFLIRWEAMLIDLTKNKKFKGVIHGSEHEAIKD